MVPIIGDMAAVSRSLLFKVILVDIILLMKRDILKLPHRGGDTERHHERCDRSNFTH